MNLSRHLMPAFSSRPFLILSAIDTFLSVSRTIEVEYPVRLTVTLMQPLGQKHLHKCMSHKKIDNSRSHLVSYHNTISKL